MATLKLTPQWIVQFGISAGHDVAPWTVDRKPSAIACLDYSTTTNHDNLYLCASGINDGKYAYNNVQQYDATWNHRFNAKRNTSTEVWEMYERDVPNVALQRRQPNVSGDRGKRSFWRRRSVDLSGSGVRCDELSQSRSELEVVYRHAIRTAERQEGAAYRHTRQVHGEHPVRVENLRYHRDVFRPELRFDHSWDGMGYNGGKARNQLFFGVDLIYKF